MPKIEIIAAGQLKKGPMFELCEEYIKRLTWPLVIITVESRYKDGKEMQADENKKIMGHIRDDSHVIALDERGKSMSSVEFARAIEKIQNVGKSHIQFVIGGASGLSDDIRKRANLVLGLGAQTWPHMLARVMLLEQIYRAQQILSGHPYHRE
jgi:23S rRNA (pseudouridine1915-N3)-methyltransferase